MSIKLVHGGDVYRHPNVLDFSTNTNPLGTPDSVMEAAARSMQNISRYPDVLEEKLIHRLAQYEQVPEEWLICGNGAAELIFSFVLANEPEKALIASPTFAEYAQAVESVNCRILWYEIKEDQDFRLTEKYLDALTPDLDLICLCNPNNPTGITIDPNLLTEILKRCRKNNTLVLLDECFQDFLDDPDKLSRKKDLPDYPNLFILKAFTKRYAMPGLRLGYGICANAEILDRMHRVVQPWNVSVPAQAAGAAALDEEEYVQWSRKLVREERDFLKEGLKKTGFRVFDSEANYIFFKGPEDLKERALERNVLIRSCSNYHGLSEGFFRVAVRTHPENEKLLQVLSEVTSGR